MGFLNFVTKSAKPVAGPDTIARYTAGGNTNWLNSYMPAKWDLDKNLSQGFDKVVWVFKCVHVIASSQASVSIHLRDFSLPHGAIVDDKEFDKLLNRRANPYENAWKFRYRLSAQLLLSPLGAFIEVVKSGAGVVKELYLLDPGTVKPLKSSKKWVKGYEVTRADGQKDTLEPDQVIWLMNIPHPIDPYRNVTPLESAGISIETDFFARLYNRNFLKNDGRPGMLIGIDADMNSEDAEELRNLFSGGFSRAGETRIVDSKGLSVVDLTVRPRDAQWDNAIQSSKSNILAAFGVPASLMGDSAGRCLRASELVMLANGEIKRAEELVGQTFQLLQPHKNDVRVVDAKADYAKKETIYRLTTFSGRTIETNGEHPLYMATSVNQGPFKRDIFPNGWTNMSGIHASYLRNDTHNVSVKGNGVYTEVAVPVSFDAVDPQTRDADDCWEVGEDGERIPDFMFTADKNAQCAFLSGLYTKHGRLSQHTSFDIYPPNLEYAKRLQRLLQRVGVHSVVTEKKLRHMVSISGKINMCNFLAQLELEGEAKEKAEVVWERLQSDKTREQNSFRFDGLPPGMIWDRIYSVEKIGEDQTVAITMKWGDHSYLGLFWEHNTFDNAEAEIEAFWTETMKTHCDSIALSLEPLTQGMDEDIRIQYMYEEIDVLQRAERRREDKHKQEFLSGAITLDDLRERLGEPRLDLPHTRVLYLPNGVIVGTPEDVAVVRQSQLQGGTDPFGGGDSTLNPFTAGATGGNGVVGGTNDTIQQELASSGSPQATQTVNDAAARTLRSARVTRNSPLAVNPNANVDVYDRIDSMTNSGKSYVKQIDTKHDVHRDTRNKMLGFLEGTIDSWSDRQLTVVSDRMMHAKVRKGTRHWDGEPGTKNLDTEYIVSDGWPDELTGSVSEYLKSALTSAGYAEVNRLKDLGFSVPFDEDDIEYIIDKVVGRVEKSSQHQSLLVHRHIGVLDKDNKSIQEIQDTLNAETFDRIRWSVALAKWITTYSLESLYDSIYSQVDGKVYKIWNTGLQEQFRTGHGELNGKMLSIGKKFTVNDTELSHPGSVSGGEGDHCSCWLYYGVDY